MRYGISTVLLLGMLIFLLGANGCSCVNETVIVNETVNLGAGGYKAYPISCKNGNRLRIFINASSSGINFYLFDEANYNDWITYHTYSYHYILAEGIKKLDQIYTIYADGTYYAVIYNPTGSTIEVAITLGLIT
jgi:hypothetical protein